MRIAKVVGSVTLNRAHPSFIGSSLKIVTPYSLADLAKGGNPSGEDVVAWDVMGAGLGSDVAIIDGPEASNPFRPENKAVDIYVAAILDEVRINKQLADEILQSRSQKK